MDTARRHIPCLHSIAWQKLMTKNLVRFLVCGGSPEIKTYRGSVLKEFEEQVGFKPSVKEWRGDGCWEQGERWWWSDMRLTMRFTKWSGKFIPEKGKAHQKEQVVTSNEEVVGGRARVTIDDEQLKGLNRVQIVEVPKLSSILSEPYKWVTGACIQHIY